MTENDPDTADGPDTADEPTEIRPGRDFEQEYRLGAAEAGRFLVDLGEQLQASDDLTLATDEWELPFAVGEPVTLDIDYEGMGEPELEVEVAIPGRTDDEAPSVE